MSRTMPYECEHGVVVDWGDFGSEDEPKRPRCERCDAARERRSERRADLAAALRDAANHPWSYVFDHLAALLREAADALEHPK